MQQPHYRLYPILLVLTIFCAANSFSQDRREWAVNVQKEYSKSYPVGTDMIALMNRFGKMVIETWDKNEVMVEAHISVGAQTNEFANKVLDRISVTDEKKTGSIEFRTNLKEGEWPENNNGGHEMRIDWTVHLPSTATLYAENRFGGLTIGDYKGVVELNCKYGALKTGRLTNRKALTVEFGSASIESISDSSRLTFRYSKIDIAKMAGVIKGDFQFCNSMDLPLENGVQSLELKNNYTSLYLLTSKDFSADYEIAANNAHVTGKNDIVITEEKTGNPNSNVRQVVFTPNHRYVGKLGKGGGAKIVIKSNFGNIRVM